MAVVESLPLYGAFCSIAQASTIHKQRITRWKGLARIHMISFGLHRHASFSESCGDLRMSFRPRKRIATQKSRLISALADANGEGSGESAGESGSTFWDSVVVNSATGTRNDPPEQECSPSLSDAIDTSDPPRLTNGHRYAFHIDGGGEVAAHVTEAQGMYRVEISVKAGEAQRTKGRPLFLHWGIFRTDRSVWFKLHPADAPSGTEFLTGEVEAMRTPLTLVNGRQTVSLEFPVKQGPVSVNFVLYQPPVEPGTEEIWLRSARDGNFCVPVGMAKGKPDTLGVTWGKNGSVNFALFSRHADGVTLCLYNAEDANPTMEIDLEPGLHRTGDIWHVELESLGSFTRYGYRCKGEIDWESGSRFHSRQILLDPYATAIASPVAGQEDWPSPAAALGLLHKEDAPFDWEDDIPPRLPMEELIVYRMDVPGFTRDETSNLPEDLRGTFLGVAHKADHLQRMGFNAVILQPICAFDETQGPYFPVSLFAPMPSYGPEKNSLSASSSLKAMVKELHRRGIEVIMEVVVSHTAEQNDEFPKTISWRGIDASTYYITDMFGVPVKPDFGAKSFFNCNQPTVQRMVVESLQYWVETFHIDGFCFPNSSALMTGPHGQELSRPLLVEALAFNPVLAATKLIADASCPVSGVSKVLTFPHWGRWQEINNTFAIDIRKYLRGDPSQLSSLATRICGSGDMFAYGRGPSHGLNFVTGPFGLTLADLVSYSNDSEASWNCGEEGPTEDAIIIDTRMRQVRNFLVGLFLFQGVPTLQMGDEYGHSKEGDVARQESTFYWDALEDDYAQQLISFISNLALFRSRRKSLLQRRNFLEDVTWHGISAELPPAWDAADSFFLAVSIHKQMSLEDMEETDENVGLDAEGAIPSNVLMTKSLDESEAAVDSEADPEKDMGDLFLALNSHEFKVDLVLPKPPPGTTWYRVIDTSLQAGDDFNLQGPEVLPLPAEEGKGLDFSLPSSYILESFSVLLLEARVTRDAQGNPLYKDSPKEIVNELEKLQPFELRAEVV